MNFIYEEDSRHKFCHTLVDIPIDNPIDFGAKLLGDFGLLWFADLAHDRNEVVPTTLWPRIRDI